MSDLTNPLLARLDNEPVMLVETCDQQVVSYLNAAASHGKFGEMMEFSASESDEDFWPSDDSWRAEFRPYVVKDGILHIPVKGVLVHDFPWQMWGWATGYEYIYRAFKRGMEDPKVRGIALISHSPGGMVAGCFDALDKMVALKEQYGKPVRAFAQEYAYSAAYATIMIADPGGINVSRTGGVGSIGVVTMHIDYSKALENEGVKVTFIHAGKYKVEGNAYEKLSDEAKARIQARIDELYEVFVSAVARGRSMSEEDVRATEALTYTATQAISNGLADEIGTLDDAMAAYVAELSTDDDGENAMSKTTDTSAEPNAENTAQNEQVDIAASNAAAVAADRKRTGDILSCEEAEGRSELAHHIAFETDMSVEAAKAMLAKAPKAAAEPTGQQSDDDEQAETPFDKAMKDGNPEVGAESGQGDPAADEDGSQTIALARQLGLAGVRPASK